MHITYSLEKMIDYLENQNYKGNYYVQRFMNNVPTLGELGHSEQSLQLENFSTSKIKVIFRE